MELFVSSSHDSCWYFCVRWTLTFISDSPVWKRSRPMRLRRQEVWLSARGCTSSHRCGVSGTSERSAVGSRCVMSVCEHASKHAAPINPFWAGLGGSSTLECEEFKFRFVNQMLSSRPDKDRQLEYAPQWRSLRVNIVYGVDGMQDVKQRFPFWCVWSWFSPFPHSRTLNTRFFFVFIIENLPDFPSKRHVTQHSLKGDELCSRSEIWTENKLFLYNFIV